MTTIKQPAPTTLQEADEVQDITVKDLIATLQTYPDDHIVFVTSQRNPAYGAELIAAVDPDTMGVPVLEMSRTGGINLIDMEDQPK